MFRDKGVGFRPKLTATRDFSKRLPRDVAHPPRTFLNFDSHLLAGRDCRVLPEWLAGRDCRVLPGLLFEKEGYLPTSLSAGLGFRV